LPEDTQNLDPMSAFPNLDFYIPERFVGQRDMEIKYHKLNSIDIGQAFYGHFGFTQFYLCNFL